MSTCDCDRKNSNGGSCDCKEESFAFESSSPVSFAPVLAATKVAGTGGIIAIEGSSIAEHA